MVVSLCSALAGGIIGYSLSSIPLDLPKDFAAALDRFTFMNESSNQTLRVFRVLGKTEVRVNSEVLESYVVGFEDRYGEAHSDNDFLDVMVELKRVRGSSRITVRIVQLGLDTIGVYLNGTLLGKAEPSVVSMIEMADIDGSRP